MIDKGIKRAFILVFALFMIFTLTGCTNRSRAVSFNDLHLQRVGETDTIEVNLILYDGDGNMTQDKNVEFTITARDYQEHIFDQETVEIEKNMIYNEYLVKFYVEIDDTLSQSNLGELTVTASFADGSFQIERESFIFDCANQFDVIYEWFEENATNSVQSLHRIFELIEGDEEDTVLIYEVTLNGSIYVTISKVTANLPNNNIRSTALSFELSDNGTYDMRLTFSAYVSDLIGTEYEGYVSGVDDHLVFDENGFGEIDFDIYTIPDDYYDDHLVIARTLAEEALVYLSIYLETNLGITLINIEE